MAYKLDGSSSVRRLRNFMERRGTQNFMERRGTPKEISDNGSNFKATKKLVMEELKRIDFDEITIKFEEIKQIKHQQRHKWEERGSDSLDPLRLL